MSTIQDLFHCPITLEIMKEPVCDKEGNSFEKSAIMDWIASHGCSPITRIPMVASDLVPNTALKEKILHNELVPLNASQTYDTENIALHAFVDNSKILISVDPGNSQMRTFLNVSCVIDVSMDMDTEATLPGENHQNQCELYGLSILDIVKHAVTAVIRSLNSNDRLAIVAFSDSAKVILPLTNMDENGQTNALTVLKSLSPTNSANLWAGLEKGLDVLNTIDNDNEKNSISTLMVFTDSEPNLNPPREHLSMLRTYRDRHGGLPGSINTFGFGYTLDSELLNDLAMEGQGGYSFIPDSGFVGTVFANAISNLKVTIARNCRLTIEPLNGATFVNPRNDLGGYLTSVDTWGLTLDIGSIQAGQTKDILLHMNNLPPEGMAYLSINFSAITRTNNVCHLSKECNAYMSNERILPTYFRFKFINVIKTAMKLMKNGDESREELYKLIDNLIKEIENSCSDVNSLALLHDIKATVIESLKPDYFQKWGRHYLPTLVYAHLYQVCNNFKDAGPQVYGGSLFKQLRYEAVTLFCSLPPPEPSKKRSLMTRNLNMGLLGLNAFFHGTGIMLGGLKKMTVSIVQGGRNNTGVVCFHGEGHVRMFGGLEKKVKSIVKGDRIQTSSGIATVVCVVESKIAEKMVELVECITKERSNRLLVTPWHPIRLNESQDWIFPISLAEPTIVPCESVFNFVLNEHHVINIDKIDCVTLGHSFKDSVCAHEYFGTTRVIDDLQAMRHYESGLIKLVGVHRDPITSKVDGLFEE